MQQSPSRQSDNPSTTENNNATTEIFPQNEPSLSRYTTYAVILSRTIQKYTGIDVSNFFSALSVRYTYSLFFLLGHTNHSTFFLYFLGAIHINTSFQQKQQYVNKQNIKKTVQLKIQEDSASHVLRFDRNLPVTNSALALKWVFQISTRGPSAGRRR